jgi:hypothetical protein
MSENTEKSSKNASTAKIWCKNIENQKSYPKNDAFMPSAIYET